MNTERLQDDEVPAPRFAENFWGKDDAGYSALTTRMRHAKLTCQEILGMFQARAALEEEYGKKLLKLSKSPLGKDELGSLRDSLDVVRYEVEATGKSHIELASKIRDQLEVALAEFNNAQKEKRKLHQVAIDRTFRNKQLYLQQLIKAKEKYDAECLRTKGLNAAKMNLVGKELDKVSIKMEKTELASRAADVEYQASIRQLTEINDKWIMEWRTACDKFQLLEEQRIEYVRTTLWNYANIVSSTCVADDESCERIRASLEECDVNQNLAFFVETCATGDDAPDITAYLTAASSGSENPLDSPALARVQAVQQEMKTRTVSGPHQPISAPGSGPSSRRQSVHSIADREAAAAEEAARVELALNIGGNVFKLDPQTQALLNQTEDPARTTTPGAYNAGGAVSAATQPRPPPATDRSPGQPPVENSLGISLDVSGTVKENRFPHWQPQAQQQMMQGVPQIGPIPGSSYHQQQQPTRGQSMPGGMAQVQQRMSGGPTIVHTRSQTMPQNDPGSGAGNSGVQGAIDPNVHRRSQSGIPAQQQQQQQQQFQQSYHGQSTATSFPQPAPTTQQPSRQTTPDGKPILFYVRVIYDYEATIPEELSLKEGDVLAVLHAREDGWWEGDLLSEIRGPIRGLFPSNFTEPTA
ncbi:Proline-serine-threonine phosphatase-interacting protein 2 [Gryganskiella cystojenkinii]|nr:Proline-serine-threonine phosphatase-interacting protein 2 [Gryganskiella cystojenkinii]